MNRLAYKNKMENKLKSEQPYETIGGTVCFQTKSKGYIRLDTLGGKEDCIVIEFAENKAEAKNNRFEDGDIFPISYYSEEDMLQLLKSAIVNS